MSVAAGRVAVLFGAWVADGVAVSGVPATVGLRCGTTFSSQPASAKMLKEPAIRT
jgi:hypothetical protein